MGRRAAARVTVGPPLKHPSTHPPSRHRRGSKGHLGRARERGGPLLCHTLPTSLLCLPRPSSCCYVRPRRLIPARRVPLANEVGNREKQRQQARVRATRGWRAGARVVVARRSVFLEAGLVADGEMALAQFVQNPPTTSSSSPPSKRPTLSSPIILPRTRRSTACLLPGPLRLLAHIATSPSLYISFFPPPHTRQREDAAAAAPAPSPPGG